jgi:GH43 family beta-xylosidase
MSRKTISFDYSTEDEAKRVYQYFSRNYEEKTGDGMFDRVPDDHNQI